MSLRASTLIRLYPRAWRARYGEEFLAILGDDALTLQQVIDVVSGAIDARLSSDVQHAVGADATQGGSAMLQSLLACERKSMRATERDGLIGATVMIGASLLFSVLGVAAKRGGWLPPAMVESLLAMAFPAALTLSMPFWLMKGQPWKAQAMIVGGTLAMLLAIGWLRPAR